MAVLEGQSGAKSRRRSGAIALFAVANMLAVAIAQNYKEAEVKAAFLYHFTGYVEWPASAFASNASPFVIGVLGKSDVFPSLQNVVRGKNWNGRSFAVRHVDTAKEMRECHVLFVASTEAKRLPQILEVLDDAPVLIVGESEGFAQRGGMVNFFMEQNRVRFEINPDAATRVRLTISSKLLNLAKVVRQ